MSEQGGWIRGDMFRAGPGGELPVFSVTRLPPELQQQLQQQARPVPRGEPGYGENSPDLVPGSVRGYRWWGLAPGGQLLGMHAPWTDGENTAACLSLRRTGGGYPPAHPPDAVPAKGCHCGFYAFWTVQPQFVTGLPPVLGVIEGYGRVRSGTKGFRCGKARILAVHVPNAIDGHGLVRPDVEAMGLIYPRVRVYRDLEHMAGEFPPDPSR